MNAENSLLLVAQLVSPCLVVLGQIGLLVIVAGAVRRHRPDAYGGLLAWAVASLVVTIASPLAHTAAGILAASGDGGIERFMHWQAALAIGLSLVHVALVVVLARALVKLAQPPKPLIVESGEAYR